MPRCALAGCLALVFAGSMPADEPKPEERLAQLTAVTTKATEALGTITDETTATAARPKLDELAEQRKGLLAAVQAPPAGQAITVPEKVMTAAAKANEELTLAHDRIFAERKPVYKALHGSKLFDQIEQPLEERATATAKMLQNATKAYSAKNRGKMPGQLTDLAVTPAGRTPLVEGGGKALLDPWGAPFQYAVSDDENGNPAAAVWTVSPYSGKKLGSPPPEKKRK